MNEPGVQMTTASVIVAFAVTALIEWRLIPLLRAEKLRQTERDDGPESHKKKTWPPYSDVGYGRAKVTVKNNACNTA